MSETHGRHPSEKEYVKIAVILGLVTAAEVGVYYIESLKPLIAPILIAMAVVKFALVALWFMHLRFDSHIFRRFLILGIILALVVFTIVLLTFNVVTRPGSIA